MRVALVRRNECVPKKLGSSPMLAIHWPTNRAYCRVVIGRSRPRRPNLSKNLFESANWSRYWLPTPITYSHASTPHWVIYITQQKVKRCLQSSQPSTVTVRRPRRALRQARLVINLDKG
jgi:hypothetical protein